ncbi:MAG: trimethylamine methyltransferase family protein [Deltaproteobacteria bacterium]|nr:trimethylamine methyltransferase family protein [Deltaproteobacteria bacterium]
MGSGGLSGEIYRPLSEVQVSIIHERALDLLEDCGMTYAEGLNDVLNVLIKAGFIINEHKQRIYFPRQLVKELLAQAPGEYTLYSRDGKNDLRLGKHRVYAGTGGTAIRILDLDTGEARQTILKDSHNVARIVEQMENIHFFQSPCVPHDLPVEHYDFNIVFSAMMATKKHIMFGCNSDSSLRETFRMVSRIVGGEDILREKPVFSVSACIVISPMKFCTQSTRNVLTAGELGIPATVTSAPMSGSTSPMTMAGTLLQTHAEVLAAIALLQAHYPGAKVLYGGLPAMADMRSMGYQGGGVECGMMTAAIHQLSRHIDVPNYCSSGLSDSKTPDAQAGWEKAYTTCLAIISGNNFIHHAAGMLESMLCIAFEQYIMDDEIIGQGCKILEGINTDEDHLAYDTIRAVGPGGNYLTSDHTLAHIRKEYFKGNGVSDQGSRDDWIETGSLTARDRAVSMAKRILEQPLTAAIDPDIEKQIRRDFKIYLR